MFTKHDERKMKNLGHIESLARSHTKTAIRVLAGIMREPTVQPMARVAAAKALLDRGWGKPTERHEHVSLNAVAELSDDELRNAIALLRAAPTPPVEPGDGGESTDDKAKLN